MTVLLEAICAGWFGLLVGSFLNVVIYRLPQMMARQWARECAEHAGTALPPADPFNLCTPRSHCPHCRHAIAWYHNIPVLSYLFLKGRCAHCGASFGLRYPLVELATGALFFWCVQRWGVSPEALAWCGFGATLLVLALIDADTQLLPDTLTLPLLWAGLLAASLHWIEVDLRSAVWGAAAGYLSLWLVYWVFKLLTGKEGMGRGDFKLLAALGAWLGGAAVLPIIFWASSVGAVVGIALERCGRLGPAGQVPFGPFLAGAGALAMVLGPRTLFGLFGL